MRNALCFFLLVYCAAVEVLTDTINHKDCGRGQPISRIVNGRAITKFQVPWIVYVQIANKWAPNNITEAMCGGSIISEIYVLTAAHCVDIDGKRPFWTRVYYNTSEMLQGPSEAVDKYVVHPDFTWDTLANDIALLKLRSPIAFDRSVRPVCLPKHPLSLIHRHAIVAGWGRVSEEGDPSQNLLFISRLVLPYDMCKFGFVTKEQAVAFNTSMVICTSARGKDSCQGDSGGPLTMWSKLAKTVQIGLVSFGVGCARGEKPSIYTRVSFYVPWIEKEIAKVDQKHSGGERADNAVHRVHLKGRTNSRLLRLQESRQDSTSSLASTLFPVPCFLSKRK
ncbi:trypsin-like [Amblyomma americanum]